MKYLIAFLLMFSPPVLADHIKPGDIGVITWYCDNPDIIERIYLSSGEAEDDLLLALNQCWSISIPIRAVAIEYLKTVYDKNVDVFFEIYHIDMELYGVGFTGIKIKRNSV